MAVDDFTQKNPNKLRVDPEKNLIFVPGNDQPQELIRPITQRIGADGIPYQHQASASELIEAQEQHERTMRYIRDVIKLRWKCTQCGKVYLGTELGASTQMLELLREMLSGKNRVDWKSITEHLREHIRCRDISCKAPVDLLREGEA